ncbi:MAG: UPF0146 family protein, partial [Candidatus Omnitrophota bacterium]
VQNRVMLFQDEAVAKGLDFEANLIDMELVIARCDLNLLGVVIDNVIQNAIKYTEKGKITVILSKDYQEPGDQECAVIEVIDTGIGIPKDEQGKIFTRHYRASNVGDIHGTGIGLDATAYIVSTMLGKIKIDSDLNRGTNLRIELPLAKESETTYRVDGGIASDDEESLAFLKRRLWKELFKGKFRDARLSWELMRFIDRQYFFECLPFKEGSLISVEGAYIAFADSIAKSYSGKVVEVGIGSETIVARRLAEKGRQVFATDVYKAKYLEDDSFKFILDNIKNPNRSIYEGASLIYALHPYDEMWKPMAEMALSVGASLAIMPLVWDEDYVELRDYPLRMSLFLKGGHYPGFILYEPFRSGSRERDGGGIGQKELDKRDKDVLSDISILIQSYVFQEGLLDFRALDAESRKQAEAQQKILEKVNGESWIKFAVAALKRMEKSVEGQIFVMTKVIPQFLLDRGPYQRAICRAFLATESGKEFNDQLTEILLANTRRSANRPHTIGVKFNYRFIWIVLSLFDAHWLNYIHIIRIVKAFCRESNDRMNILDMGCGVLSPLVCGALGGAQVNYTGLDIDPVLTAFNGRTARILRRRNNGFLTGLAGKMPLTDESVDVIIIGSAEADMREVKRVLKPSGIVVLTCHDLETVHFIYLAMLNKAGFEIIEEGFSSPMRHTFILADKSVNGKTQALSINVAEGYKGITLEAIIDQRKTEQNKFMFGWILSGLWLVVAPGMIFHDFNLFLIPIQLFCCLGISFVVSGLPLPNITSDRFKAISRNKEKLRQAEGRQSENTDGGCAYSIAWWQLLYYCPYGIPHETGHYLAYRILGEKASFVIFNESCFFLGKPGVWGDISGRTQLQRYKREWFITFMG